MILLTDYSKAFEQAGLKQNVITNDGAEDYKGMGAVGTALTPKHKADLKRQCNEAQSVFDTALVAGRGWDTATVGKMSDGRVYRGAAALDLGLIDAVGAFDEMLVRWQASEAAAASNPAQEPADTDTTEEGDGDASANSAVSSPHFPSSLPVADAAATTSITPITPSKETDPMAFWDDFASSCKNMFERAGFNPDKPDAAAPVAHATTDAATNAATAQATEIARLRAEQAQGVKDKQDKVSALAVTAFGQGSASLTEAQGAIAACADLAALTALETAYNAVVKTDGARHHGFGLRLRRPCGKAARRCRWPQRRARGGHHCDP